MIVLTGPTDDQSRNDRRLVPYTETSSENERSELQNSHPLVIDPDPSNDDFTLATAPSLQAYLDQEFPESWHSPTSTSDWLTPKHISDAPWDLNLSPTDDERSIAMTQEFLDHIAQGPSRNTPHDIKRCDKLLDKVTQRLNRDYTFLKTLRKVRDDLASQASAMVYTQERNSPS